jgi:hypothetical protein
VRYQKNQLANRRWRRCACTSTEHAVKNRGQNTVSPFRRNVELGVTFAPRVLPKCVLPSILLGLKKLFAGTW